MEISVPIVIVTQGLPVTYIAGEVGFSRICSWIVVKQDKTIFKHDAPSLQI